MKSEEVLSVLKIISEHLGTIGNELKQIRNLLQSKDPSLAESNSGYKTCQDKSEVISLDLEAFTAKIKAKNLDD